MPLQIIRLALAISMCLSGIQVFGDVKSATGVIYFDTNNGGEKEASLSTNGLKVGTGIASANLDISGNAIITQSLSIGNNTSNSNLHVTGTYSQSSLIISDNTRISGHSMALVDTSAGNISISLPDPRLNIGEMLSIKKVSSLNSLVIAGGGGNIDQDMVITSPGSNLSSYNFISNGQQWFLMGSTESSITNPLNSLSANTTLHWGLNETSGNIASDIKGAHHGTLQNDHQFSGNSTSGAFYQALSLDDINDSIEAQIGGNAIASQYSWSLWFKSSLDASSTPSTPPTDPPDGTLGFSYSSGNSLWQKTGYHQLADSSYIKIKVTSTLSTTQWNHILGTWNGSTFKLYCNGVLQGTENATSISPHAGQFILEHHGGSPSSSLSLDECQLFNRALEAEEVLKLYHSGAI